MVRTSPDDTYTSPNYVPGHVPGGDHGTTAGTFRDCTVPTSPTTNLPNTGSSTTPLALTALGLLTAGTALVAASRRRSA